VYPTVVEGVEEVGNGPIGAYVQKLACMWSDLLLCGSGVDSLQLSDKEVVVQE